MEHITQLPALPRRPVDSNKGEFGKILVIAGSRGMSGAAVLCGSAALRGGAGLVRVAVPQELWPIIAAGNPCLMTAPMSQDDHGRISAAATGDLVDLAQANDVVALGPGLGQSADLSTLVATLVQQISKPLVLDADGLNTIAARAEVLGKHAGPVIITPHPGEFGRLLHMDTAAVQARRQELAAEFAARHGLIVVLKGHDTVVTDGRRVYRNNTGNPGMATAGAGDVLTGLIAALLGQGLDAFAAAQLGVHVHGRAGDLARDELGERGLIATDLLSYLPRAF
jgi:ADP-dependent NAD(P)H-hydrate dehydratase